MRKRLLAGAGLATGLLSAVLAGGFAAVASTAAAAAPSAAPAAAARLDGFWRLKAQGKIERAAQALTASAKAQVKPGVTRGDEHLEESRWCIFQGMPYLMTGAGPIDIIVGTEMAVIMAEKNALPRHIYFNATHPDPDVYDFTRVGHSVGRWEGDVLVVDTTMFRDAQLGPNGVPLTDEARLVERFELADGGRTLQVHSTWTDENVYTQPYSYTLNYERLPDSYTAEEVWCDPTKNGVGTRLQ